MLGFGEDRLLQNLLRQHKDHPFLSSRVLAEIPVGHESYKVQGLFIGHNAEAKRQLCITGGIHGLEKIGTRLLLYYLDSFLHRLTWNKSLQTNFEHTRILFIPIVNPGGMAMNMRSTPEGIDMMRNAPVDSRESVPFLAGGHRWSPKLPWYRGKEKDGMCLENRVLADFIQSELFKSELSINLDLHSGFGKRDRLWYPFAHTKKQIDREELFHEFKTLMRKIHPHHVYQIESQSSAYCTHGDIWDYLYLQHREKYPKNYFFPWTLEMGSWLWLKKNPMKLMHRLGIFNPTLKHRHRRILRRHYNLLEFFFEYVANVDYESWNTGSC